MNERPLSDTRLDEMYAHRDAIKAAPEPGSGLLSYWGYIDDLLKEVAFLRTAVTRYGGHGAWCDHLLSDPHGCSCGWKDVRNALRTRRVPERHKPFSGERQ